MKRTALSLMLLCLFIGVRAQCLDDLKIFTPPPSSSGYTGFGDAMDIYNDYLVVSAPNHDSLALEGGVVFVFQFVDGQWRRVAELTPSTPHQFMYFGEKVGIGKDVIVVSGVHRYTETSQEWLYVFEKDSTEGWASGTESYRFQPEELPDSVSLHLKFDVFEDVLAIAYKVSKYTESRVKHQIFSFTKGYLKHDFDLDIPVQLGYSVFCEMYLDHNKVVLSDHTYGDFYSTGLLSVFFFNRTSGVLGNPIRLVPKPSMRMYSFGHSVAVSESRIFTLTGRENRYLFVFDVSDPGVSILESSQYIEVNDDSFSAFHSKNCISLMGDYLIKPSTSYGHFAFHDIYDLKSDPQFTLEMDSGYYSFGFVSNSMHFIYQIHTSIDRENDFSFVRTKSFHELDSDEFEDQSSQDIFYYDDATSAGDFYGFSSAFYNDRGVVSSFYDDEIGYQFGAVHLLERNSHSLEWDSIGVIYPPITKYPSGFGYDVEIHKDFIFVGAPYSDGDVNTGRVLFYLYNNDSWVLKGEIVPPLSDAHVVNFGVQLAYSDGYLAIGRRSPYWPRERGGVYLFKINEEYQWDYVTQFSVDSWDYIGLMDFVFTDSLLIIGGDQDGVHIFKKEGDEWGSRPIQATLKPNRDVLDEIFGGPVERMDLFGQSIVMSGDKIIVGAPKGDKSGLFEPSGGAAYVYEMPKGGWDGNISHISVLKPAIRSEYSSFGYSLESDGRYVYVGAPHSFSFDNYQYVMSKEVGQSAVYLFDWNDVTSAPVVHETASIASPFEGYDAFGAHISNNSLEIVISAHLANTEVGDQSGAIVMLKKVGSVESDYSDVCEDHGPIEFLSYPVSGGNWTGTGITDAESGVFDPLGLEGNVRLTYSYEECESSILMEVFANPKVDSVGLSNQSKCEGESVDIFLASESKGLRWTWFFKGANHSQYVRMDEFDGQTAISVIQPGEYYCEVTNGVCDPQTFHFEVHDRHQNSDLASTDDEILLCEAETVTLSLLDTENVQHVVWYGDMDGFNQFEPISLTLALDVVAESGSYYCVFTSEECEYISDTIQVRHIPNDLTFGELPIVCREGELLSPEVFPRGGFYEVDGEEYPDLGVIRAEDLGNGTHTISYKVDLEGCLYAVEQTLQVEIYDLDNYTVPNVFTPNGDGKNDFFEIEGVSDDYMELVVRIFDRSGNLVFADSKAGFKWSGDGSTAGVYFWFIEFSNTCTAQNKHINGYVTLLR